MTETDAVPARSRRPLPGEYADYAQADIDAVQGDDALAVLERLADEMLSVLRTLPADRVGEVRYAPVSGRSRTSSPISRTMNGTLPSARPASRVERRSRFPISMRNVMPSVRVRSAVPGEDLLAEGAIVRAATGDLHQLTAVREGTRAFSTSRPA